MIAVEWSCGMPTPKNNPRPVGHILLRCLARRQDETTSRLSVIFWNSAPLSVSKAEIHLSIRVALIGRFADTLIVHKTGQSQSDTEQLLRILNPIFRRA